MTPPSDRERFCIAVNNGTITRADAIVLLTGDGESRVPTAVGLFQTGAAPWLVITGGLREPPYAIPADVLAGAVYAKGIAPDRIRVDLEATNTREQAVNVVAMAKAEHWKRLLLVASPYHHFRAFLTFLKALHEAELDDTVCMISVPAGGQPWFAPVHALTTQTRLELLTDDFAKIDAYQEQGHVASYAEGLAYLKAWEGR